MDLVVKYLKWNFIDRPKEIIEAIKNVLVFGLHFFSLKQILVSFFTPWKKTDSESQGLFNFEVIAGNIIAIAIGMVMRIFLIVFCLIFELIVLIVGIIALLIWMLLPLIIIYILIKSFQYA
jgi:hypothetical protein